MDVRLAIVALLVGCGDSRKSIYLGAIDPAYTSCDLDSDCVAVDLSNCNRCGDDGRMVAVNVESRDAVLDEYYQEFGMCDDIGCSDLPASCVGGTCQLEYADTGSP